MSEDIKDPRVYGEDTSQDNFLLGYFKNPEVKKVLNFFSYLV